MTLPLIHAMSQANRAEFDFLLGLLKGNKNDRLAELDEAREGIRKNNGFVYARQVAEKLVDDSIESLSVFSSCQNQQALDTLIGLARYVIEREK